MEYNEQLNQQSANPIPINSMYSGEAERQAAIPPPLEEEETKEEVKQEDYEEDQQQHVIQEEIKP